MLLITGGVKSWSVVAALQEAGMEIVGTSVKKSTKEDKEKIKELMGEDAHMIDDMRRARCIKCSKTRGPTSCSPAAERNSSR